MSDPLLLVPGLMCTAEMFLPQITASWPVSPVMVASTMTGSSMEDMAASVLASAPGRFTLAGFSMGGYIALEIMRQAPGRVTKLALLNTAARADTPEQTARRRLAIEMVQREGLEAWLRSNAPFYLHPSRKQDPALVETIVRMGLAVGAHGFLRQIEAITDRIDSRPGLGAIAVPTLVLVGESDEATPPERSREMADAIEGAELVVVENSGHFATLEQPEAVNRALLSWLQP